MENKIPVEMHERIFALYWGQYIAHGKDWHHSEHQEGDWQVKFPVDSNYDNSDFFLHVKPLSMITDEDAEKLADILRFRSDEEIHKLWGDGRKRKDLAVRSMIDERSIQVPGRRVAEAIDFLRANGYALPAYGYTVEQLVEAGVFKLVGNG